MCQKCYDAVKRHWPELPEEDYGALLMSATAFPLAGPDAIEKQLADLAQQTGCDVGKAIALVDAESSAMKTKES
jgi:hypothetical protein